MQKEINESERFISQEGVTSVPNIIGKKCTKDDCVRQGFLGIYSGGNVNIEHTNVNVKQIDGVVLGSLNLKKGTDIQKTTMKQQSNTVDFDLSLMGLSVGMKYGEGRQKARSETHHRSEFFAQEITLVVDDKLKLEGAIIDGEVIKLEAGEVLVKNVVDTVKSQSHFMQVGVGVMFNFWTGGLAPQFSFGAGKDTKETEFVKFISQVTGQEVEIVAEKVTASLNQVSGAEDLKLFNEERITGNNPTNNFHHQAWSTTGSIGIGLDGKINPSITPVFERDGTRISAFLSRDLLKE